VTLLICRTCPRYDTPSSGEFGRALAAAIAENPGGAAVTVRKVQCLGGCPDDGVAAVDGPGKARVRFSRLDAGHAAAVIAAAAAHDACTSGTPGDWLVPAELADRISSVTPKRGRDPGR
jgi:predicted metal-binding protein